MLMKDVIRFVIITFIGLLIIALLSGCSLFTNEKVIYSTVYPSLPPLQEPNVLSLNTCEWEYPLYKDDKVFVGLDEKNFKCYIENKEILVSSPHNSKSDKICFFSMKTYQIVCHLQGVHIYLNRNFCKYDEDRLIISGFNHISMINISKYFVEWKVMIPEMYSRSIVKINDNVLIGTYRDGNLVKLNLKTKEYFFIRKIHNEWINYIDRFGKDLFMSCAGSIRIWRYEGKD